jgi:hypothetical protein
MKYIIFLLLLNYCVSHISAQTPNAKNVKNSFEKSLKYSVIFGQSYKEALQLYKKEKKMWKNTFIDTTEFLVMSAVVFPELIRYSQLKDLFETEMLSLLYVEQGSKVCDFSIGQFQMKPSFAENIEIMIKQDSILNQVCNFSYTNKVSTIPSLKTTRKLRLLRLQNRKWQLQYLHAFYLLMQQKTATLTFSNTQQKIRLFATAYNAGFQLSIIDLIAKQNDKYFPYGKHIWRESYSYADVAIEFYEKKL